eukprot:TRINITY_DN66473_c0_g1_i1.p1 TRINITY_DN66473_c0_g1~~TRINITY_DN66473_c0_g1_i1.p1  ORF type:complete len:401 (-),score=101.33 TRINITY_DN66473_c0_g1_i1:60-1262(-)
MGCGSSVPKAALAGDEDAAVSAGSKDGSEACQGGGSSGSTSAPPPDDGQGEGPGGAAYKEADELRPGAQVSIAGIKAKPHLNGQVGVVIKFDGGPDERYTVRLPDETQVSLRRSSLSRHGGEQAQPPVEQPGDGERTDVEPLSPKSAASVPAGGGGVSIEPPLHADGANVLVNGIEKKPELNGKVGQIVAFEGGADRRYTVSVIGMHVKLKESSLTATEAPTSPTASGSLPASPTGGLPPPPAAVPGGSDAEMLNRSGLSVEGYCDMADEADGGEDDPPPPLGELDGRGVLVPKYHWVEVPSVASLPLGMEVWMPMAGKKWARIPSTWRLQIPAEGQIDTYRCDVGEHTLLTEVLAGSLAAFGWTSLELRKDGKPIAVHEAATVGSESLFGGKMSAVKLE